MPTFSAIALDNLLEPRVRESLKKPEPEKPYPGNERSRHLYISPALYATPEQSPIPEYSSPDPPSPSPYVANHKRRGGGRVRIPELRRGGYETEGFSTELDAAEMYLNEAGAEEEDEARLDLRSEVASELDAPDFSQIQMETRSFVSAQGEFFDAIDGII